MNKILFLMVFSLTACGEGKTPSISALSASPSVYEMLTNTDLAKSENKKCRDEPESKRCSNSVRAISLYHNIHQHTFCGVKRDPAVSKACFDAEYLKYKDE